MGPPPAGRNTVVRFQAMGDNESEGLGMLISNGIIVWGKKSGGGVILN